MYKIMNTYGLPPGIPANVGTTGALICGCGSYPTGKGGLG